MIPTADQGVLAPSLPSDVSVRRWFALFGVFWLALAVPLAVLLSRQQWDWSAWKNDPTATFAATSLVAKLLIFTLYLSICTTFLPLPTGWIVAGLAMRSTAVGGDLWTTTLIVAAVGAVGSTVANLNDYHIFTWMLRHRRLAAVRQTRGYAAAVKWFERSPFFLLALFNLIPIPVDVIRMLATAYRYPRMPFAAANFIGRFARYGVIAFVTYYWKLGWIAPASLLALAVAAGAVRVGWKFLAKLSRRSSCVPAGQASANDQAAKEQSA